MILEKLFMQFMFEKVKLNWSLPTVKDEYTLLEVEKKVMQMKVWTQLVGSSQEHNFFFGW